MPGDKYTAVWVSHSSIKDFLDCQRAYFLKNIYKDPNTGHKIQITSSSLSLGQAVHEVIESLSILPVDKRFNSSIFEKYEDAWRKVSGKKGGFFDLDVEQKYKARGRAMIDRVNSNPGPLLNKAVKIKNDLPNFWLSDEDNIILCGKIDWLEYLPEIDSVHIIDFKTGKKDEDEASMQLPIYYLLVKNCQGREVVKMSYWYIERMDAPVEKILPDYEEAKEKILKIARFIKTARSLERFKCEHGGCYACEPFERILKGEGEFVGPDAWGRDTYIVNSNKKQIGDDSEIL